jgi:hypothetical protein
MDKYHTGECHYRVVRYFHDFSAGLVREELAHDLSLEEAQDLAAREHGRVPGEEISVQDENLKGLEAEVDFPKKPSWLL